MKSRAAAAWFLAAMVYLHQFVNRTAPGLMIAQLSDAFGLSTVAVASLAGVFYYGYCSFSLVAGLALDRIGARIVIPAGALMMALGALLFGTGSVFAANMGRFLQGAGGVFSLVGAIYLASKYFPASRSATLIGATQMCGMAGAAAGPFLIGPMIVRGLPWKAFWNASAVAGLVLALILFLVTPRKESGNPSGKWVRDAAVSFATVFRNPQSILCGAVSGLLYLPTTILTMIWGVQFLQQGHGLEYGEAVLRSATVPVGWIFGCPIVGMISDRLGRRKPVIIWGSLILFGCVAWVLYGRPELVPPYLVGLVAGFASGAAMLPFTVIREANPPELAGTVAGVMSFLVFTLSALLGPVFGWILHRTSGGEQVALEHYQTTFQPILWGIAVAAVLTFALKETGPAARIEMAKVRIA
jgi:MFS family permease